MAEVVSASHAPAQDSGFWPVDRLFIGYLAAMALLIGIEFRQVPSAPLLLAAHAAGIALIAAAARARLLSQPVTVFRHWYPLAYIPVFYWEMAILIQAIRHADLTPRWPRWTTGSGERTRPSGSNACRIPGSRNPFRSLTPFSFLR